MQRIDFLSLLHSVFPSVPSLRGGRRVLLFLPLLCGLASCSSDDEPPMPAPPQEDLQEVTLYLSLPALSDSVDKRSMGDPGEQQEEGEDWNTLVLFVVYEEGQAQVGDLVRTFKLTKDDYEALPLIADTDFRRYRINVPAGKAYFYGVTYSSGDKSGFADQFKDEKALAQFDSKEDVEGLTISNYYPYAAPATDDEEANVETDVAKFCSVASGYYIGNGVSSTDWRTAQPESYEITYSAPGMQDGQIPTLTLRRLAAKIDVQWDAEGAYSGGTYTNARVTGFTYHGSAEGRVFPEIAVDDYLPVLKDWAFSNLSPISWRNGRTYHYTFPDGKTTPRVTFNIDTQTEESEEWTEKPYTLKWGTHLQRATWYKVNVRVQGNTSSGDIDITSWNNGSGN